MKRKNKQIISILLVILLIGTAFGADATSDRIKDLEEEKKETEQQLEDVNEEVNQLEEDKTDLQEDLQDYNSRMSSIKEEIAEGYAKIQAKEAEIQETSRQLDEAKEQEEQQFESMKIRIKFMYENGTSNALEALLSAQSFSDFLNRADFIKSVMDYDRKQLEEYKETKEKIALAQETLQQERKDLQTAQESVQTAEVKLANLINSTQNGIEQYAADIREAEERALAYEKKLEEQENQLENLKEILAREQAISNGTVNIGRFTYHEISDLARSSSDLEILAAIIECEAGGEPYEGQLAVGSVVMNRVKSNRFPNTILEVIHQKNQFSPVRSGRFALVLTRGAKEQCRNAAQEVLNGTNTIDALFFRVNTPLITGTVIGNHVFY